MPRRLSGGRGLSAGALSKLQEITVSGIVGVGGGTRRSPDGTGGNCRRSRKMRPAPTPCTSPQRATGRAIQGQGGTEKALNVAVKEESSDVGEARGVARAPTRGSPGVVTGKLRGSRAPRLPGSPARGCRYGNPGRARDLSLPPVPCAPPRSGEKELATRLGSSGPWGRQQPCDLRPEPSRASSRGAAVRLGKGRGGELPGGGRQWGRAPGSAHVREAPEFPFATFE